jgi:glycine cleavage system regulatory protein
LTIVVHAAASADAAPPAQFASLEVFGPDRPGIVREITRALAAQGVNVEELATECVSAPMSGEQLFQARAKLLLPVGLKVGNLRQSIEQAVTGLTVEVVLGESN